MLYLGRVQVKVKEAYYADKQFNSAVTFFHWLVKWFIIWYSKCFHCDPLILLTLVRFTLDVADVLRNQLPP